FDKRYLVPFSEYLPGRDVFPALGRWLPDGAGNLAAGAAAAVLPLHMPSGTYRLGPTICFEDTLPYFGREIGALRPHLLLNMANDAWFGDTSEPWEHLALSVFRAIELRTDLVRAVNTGVSAFIDASGR